MKTVGRYEILREVGRGGMAVVYLARQTDLDRFVALKELAAFHASDPAFAQRFLRESRVAGSLSHPNVVTVHDYFEHEGTPYIAMEYVERGSLRPYVGSLSPAQTAGVLEGLLAGLAHAEQHAIVHRDLKPENLMVTADGRVKIADFGIAKATNQMQTGAFLTATGTTVGTPTYMAPEQAMARDIGPWTDLYSVGCMAFELLTGSVPFAGSEAPMAILLRHVNEPIPAVTTVDASVDPDLSDWVERLLVKEPEARIRSAADAWDDLEEIVIGLLGPRWRRAARLTEQAGHVETPKPLTPAPFEGTSAGEPASDEFESFAWSRPAEAPPAPPVAEPTSPPVESAPPPVEAPLPTPEPPAVEPTPVSGKAEPVASGFETYAPAPPPRPPVETPPEVQAPPPVAPEPEAAPPPPPAAEPEPPPPPPPPPPPATPEAAPEPAAPPVAEPAPPAPAAAPALGETVMPRALKPKPTTEPDVDGSPRRSRAPVVVGVLAVALAVAAGLALGGSGGEEEAGPARSSLPVEAASSGAADLMVPADFAAVDPPPSVPGLELADAAGYAPGGRDGGRAVTFGMAQAADVTLLPDPFRAALGLDGGQVPERTAVKLGPDELQAFRYTGLQAADEERRVTVYAAPTSAGVLTVACLAPAGDSGFGGECEEIADTLRLTSGTPFPVGPDPAYAKTVGQAFSTLNKREAAGRRALEARGATFRRQAAAARSIASAYASAASALGKASTSPADKRLNATLVARLEAAGGAWQRAARAAARRDRGDFNRAERPIARTRQALAQAVTSLETAGYALAE